MTEKALRIILFQSQNSCFGPLFKDFKVLKSFDNTTLENCVFIGKSFKGLQPSAFSNWIEFSIRSNYQTLMIHDGENLYFNWDSLYAKLGSHYKGIELQEKKYKKIKANRKYV